MPTAALPHPAPAAPATAAARRRHDIDALRVLAFGLLILYHLAMFYVADWGWHVKSTHLAEWLQWPMLFLNRWRMDLIFLVSGLAAALLLRDGAAGAFLRLRTKRLLLPLAFGILVVVPIQPYAEGVSNGVVTTGFWAFLAEYYTARSWPEGSFSGWQHGYTWNHLWYLAYLWFYTVALALLARPLASAPGRRATAWFTGLRGPALLLVPALPLLAWTLLLQARFPERGDFFNDWYRNAMYFTCFLYGFLFARAEGFWAEARRLRGRALALALCCFAPYLWLVEVLPDEVGPALQAFVWTLRNVYVWTMLLAILGYASTWLDRPFRWLPWAREAVYPWYILHQSLIVGLGFALAGRGLGPVAEPALILALTIAACWAVTEAVRATPWLRPLFGLAPRRAAAPLVVAAQGAR